MTRLLIVAYISVILVACAVTQTSAAVSDTERNANVLQHYVNMEEMFARLETLANSRSDIIRLSRVAMLPPPSSASLSASSSGSSSGSESESDSLPLPLHHPIGVTLTNFSCDIGDFGASKTRVVVLAGEHGRELITTQTALQLIETAVSFTSRVDSDTGMPLPHTHMPENTAQGQWMTTLLRNVEFHIVPVLNTWGRHQIESKTDMCSRKNAAGVDLSSNWDAARHLSPKLDATHEKFGGVAAFTEPETIGMHTLVTNVRPHLFINLHSGADEMYLGWDHKQEPIPNARDVEQLLAHVSDTYTGARFGQTPILTGAPSYGTSTDFVYQHVYTPLSVTFAVFKSMTTSDPSDCLLYYNPGTLESVTQTAVTWSSAIFGAAAFAVSRRSFGRYEYPVFDHSFVQHSVVPSHLREPRASTVRQQVTDRQVHTVSCEADRLLTITTCVDPAIAYVSPAQLRRADFEQQGGIRQLQTLPMPVVLGMVGFFVTCLVVVLVVMRATQPKTHRS
jgi:Zinc carboxypeptidase